MSDSMINFHTGPDDSADMQPLNILTPCHKDPIATFNICASPSKMKQLGLRIISYITKCTKRSKKNYLSSSFKASVEL